MKLWKCRCGETTLNVEEALRHTKDNGHMMALIEVPDTSRYSAKVNT